MPSGQQPSTITITNIRITTPPIPVPAPNAEKGKLGRILTPPGRSADFLPTCRDSNVGSIREPGQHANSNRVRASLRNGKSALRRRCHQEPTEPGFRNWSLVFEVSLVLGAWDLEL